METFTAFAVFHLDGFPPAKPVAVLVRPFPVAQISPEGYLFVEARPTRRFGGMILGKDRSVVATFESEPVEIKGLTTVILAVRFDGNETIAMVRTVESRTDIQPLTSVQASDATEACAKWMEKRAKSLKSTTEAPPHTRPKSNDELIEEYEESLRSLRSHLAQIEQGNHHLTNDVLGQLRSLIYWRGKKIANALMFRVAGMFNQPLPVYAMRRDDKSTPDDVENMMWHTTLRSAAICQTPGATTLMDIQEWLSTSIVIGLRVPPGKSSLELVESTVVDFIANAANHIGTPHISEFKPLSVSSLQEFIVLGENGVTYFIKDVGHTVVALGEWLLEQGKR